MSGGPGEVGVVLWWWGGMLVGGGSGEATRARTPAIRITDFCRECRVAVRASKPPGSLRGTLRPSPASALMVDKCLRPGSGGAAGVPRFPGICGRLDQLRPALSLLNKHRFPVMIRRRLAGRPRIRVARSARGFHTP